ncbi:hypothetical protein D3C83_31330 [compost metagenome]
MVDRVSEELLSGDPGGVFAAFVSGGAFQDPVRLHAADIAGGRLHTREQVHIRNPFAGHQPQGRRCQPAAPGRSHGVPLPGEPHARLHQARDRPAWRQGGLPQQAVMGQRAGNQAHTGRRV